MALTATSDAITSDEYDAILLEAADRDHVVGKITSRIAQTCSPTKRAKQLVAAAAEQAKSKTSDEVISEEKEEFSSPNDLSSKQAYLKECNNLLKLIDNAIYTFLKKEENKKSTQDWFGWAKQEHKASALDPLITHLWAQEMKVRTQIETTKKEIRTVLLREKEKSTNQSSKPVSGKTTDTTRLDLKKIAGNCTEALAPKPELKDHWSTMGKIRQGFWRFIRSVLNPLSITSDINIKDKKEKQSLKALASNSCFRSASLFAEGLRKKSRTSTDNKRVKARGEFIKFTTRNS